MSSWEREGSWVSFHPSFLLSTLALGTSPSQQLSAGVYLFTSITGKPPAVHACALVAIGLRTMTLPLGPTRTLQSSPCPRNMSIEFS